MQKYYKNKKLKKIILICEKFIQIFANYILIFEKFILICEKQCKLEKLEYYFFCFFLPFAREVFLFYEKGNEATRYKTQGSEKGCSGKTATCSPSLLNVKPATCNLKQPLPTYCCLSW